MTVIKAISKNNTHTITLDGHDPKKGRINGKEFHLDLVKEKNGGYHLILNDRSYNAELVKLIPEEKSIELKLNNKIYVFSFKDRYDQLLEKMGMSDLASSKVTDLKAPMPGLVLNIAVNGGSEVRKGDPLLVLEAMKMENVLKSPTDGIIKKIAVKKGDAVEKNQLLLNFE